MPAPNAPANYSFIPPGDYLFHVIACNNDGVWNETGASLAFTVLPHFWQTWWFRRAGGRGPWRGRRRRGLVRHAAGGCAGKLERLERAAGHRTRTRPHRQGHSRRPRRQPDAHHDAQRVGAATNWTTRRRRPPTWIASPHGARTDPRHGRNRLGGQPPARHAGQPGELPGQVRAGFSGRGRHPLPARLARRSFPPGR